MNVAQIVEYYNMLPFHVEFSRMMLRSAERCIAIAQSESIMGYKENSEVYLEISTEVRNLGAWVQQEIAYMEKLHTSPE